VQKQVLKTLGKRPNGFPKQAKWVSKKGPMGFYNRPNIFLKQAQGICKEHKGHSTDRNGTEM